MALASARRWAKECVGRIWVLQAVTEGRVDDARELANASGVKAFSGGSPSQGRGGGRTLEAATPPRTHKYGKLKEVEPMFSAEASCSER